MTDPAEFLKKFSIEELEHAQTFLENQTSGVVPKTLPTDNKISKLSRDAFNQLHGKTIAERNSQSDLVSSNHCGYCGQLIPSQQDVLTAQGVETE